MPSPDQIQARKTARSIAAEVAELALGELATLPAEAHAAFYEELARRLPLPQAPPVMATVEPFTDAQAKGWGGNRMKFGIHQGKRIYEIPLSYLEKLAEPNDFTRHLRRYLASHRVAVEEEQVEQSQHEYTEERW